MINSSNEYPLALKGLKVLQHIIDAGTPITSKELCQKTNIPKPTMHRILRSLEQENYITNHLNKKYYTISQAALDLSFTNFSNRQIQNARSEILSSLSKKVKETCNLSVLVGNEIVYIDRIEANWRIKVRLQIGSRLPLHSTASGKVFLAYMNKGKRLKAIQNLSLKKQSINTITTAEELIAHCQKVKKQKFAIADEEFSMGSVAISVPVRLPSQKVNLAVAIQAPKVRKSPKNLIDFLPHLKDTANDLQELYQSIQ
jgi:DNA-binding IclR family transcriptional regulator